MCTHQPINGTRAPIGRGLNVVQSVVSTSSINSRETLENRVMVNEEKYMYQTHRIIRRFEIYTKSIWRFCEQDVALFLKISNISYHRDILSSISTILFLSFNHFFTINFVVLWICNWLATTRDVDGVGTKVLLQKSLIFSPLSAVFIIDAVLNVQLIRCHTPFTISYFLS